MCLDRDVFENFLPFSRMGILIFKLSGMRFIQLIIFLSLIFMTILYLKKNHEPKKVK